jgi:hypothetical protein
LPAIAAGNVGQEQRLHPSGLGLRFRKGSAERLKTVSTRRWHARQSSRKLQSRLKRDLSPHHPKEERVNARAIHRGPDAGGAGQRHLRIRWAPGLLIYALLLVIVGCKISTYLERLD